MDKTTLGTTPEPNQGRDAVHIAVMPVTAAHDMKIGAHVGLDKDGNASEKAALHIGIIDPFFGADMLDFLKQIGVTDPIRKGERYWLLLYPNTITSLRHEWSHAVVDDVAPSKTQAGSPDKSASVLWMEEYVARHCPYYIEPNHDGVQVSKHEAYLRFLQRAAEGEIFYSGTNCHGLYDVDDADELFRHLSIILGRAVSGNDFTYSCSC